MSRYIDADVTLETLKEFLIKTATNNVGYKRDVDEVCKDIADNRLSVWMEYVPTADVVDKKECSVCVLHPFKQLREIVEQPTADVVEAVRCKDCKFRKIEFGWNGKKYKMCVNTDYPTDDDAYCSYAERREDDE